MSIIKNEKYEKIDASLDCENLDEIINNACSAISELASLFSKIELLKSVYDYYYVLKILKSSSTISQAMVKIYDEHQKDLKRLKKLIKSYLPEKYNEMFRKVDKTLHNYPSYIKYNKVNVNSSSKSKEIFSKTSRQEFYEYVEMCLSLIDNENAKEEVNYFMTKIEEDNLFLKQKTNKNGAFPMQLNLSELKTILKNQFNNYPFLKEKDNDGLSIYDKIISIFKFKIPYYVGPLNNSSNYKWLERSNDKIYPWNFEKVVDLDASAINFIERMQNKCTYLKGDNDFCLPKYSFVFSEYNCLSYLNKLQIDGVCLPTEIKNKIFNEIFLTKKQPTRKDIVGFIKLNYGNKVLTTHSKEIPEVNCNMASYIDMKRIFGDKFDKYFDDMENIIKDITVFEDKTALERRLKKYNLPENIIKQLKGLNYKKYSSLCMRLLNGIKIVNKNTGEVKGTVLEIMRKTNANLQEILYLDEYRLIDIIDEENKKYEKVDIKIDEYLDEYVNISPLYKRALIQSYNIIKEIETIFNRPIDKYYIECTRTNITKKQPSTSRYETLKVLYKSCRKDALAMNIDMNELEHNLEKKKDALKSDILYLYFTQLGRCMYTLEPIDIQALFSNNNLYDIDHIYPQALIKDDSISNRVLVNKAKNNHKQDMFLYESGVLNSEAYDFFKKLYDMKLISKEKYKRLTEKEISKEKLDGFVNRQLVTTNQTVTGLIQVLKTYHGVNPDDIIYSKAENVSAFRHEFNLVKSRTANNFHHAHDAYLNVIVGGIIHDYYSYRHLRNYVDIIRLKNDNDTLNIDNLFGRKIVKNGNKVIWDKEVMLKQIKHDMYQRFDISETFRSYHINKIAKDQIQIASASSNDKLVPVNIHNCRKDTNKYGGYLYANYIAYSKFVLFETNIKRKKTTILEFIPYMYVKDVEKYLISKGFNDFRIINNNIEINTCLKFDSRKFLIIGKSNDSLLLRNAYDRYFSYNDMMIIKKIDKYFDNNAKKIYMDKNDSRVIVAPARSKNNEAVILTIDEINCLLQDIIKMYSKKIYLYSIIKTIIENVKNNLNVDFITKIDLCHSLLDLLKTNSSEEVNLKMINMSNRTGVLKMSNKLPIGTKIIQESYTGYYKKVIYEVK